MKGGRQCSGNLDASTSPSGREVWHKRHYLSCREVCFRGAAKPAEGRGQDPVRHIEPWVGLDRSPCRGHRFLLAILPKMSNCTPDVRGLDERVKRAQSGSAFTPFEGPLRLVRPTDRSAAKN